MAHFALICPPYYSHLQVFAVLGAELVRRGHRASFVVNGGAGELLASKAPEGIAIHEAGAGGPDRLERIIARAARPSESGSPAGKLASTLPPLSVRPLSSQL